jgi:O-antigen/teichoic acid export membrane protein
VADTIPTRFLNIGLRGATLVSRFALVFALALFLEPSELGLYGLLAVTISYAIYLVGFDFYTYTTRQLLSVPRSTWSALLRDQAVYFCIAYALALPLLLVVFYQGLLPWAFFGWFFALLVLEHLGQEVNRLLIVMSEQLLAGVVLFLRSGVWVLVLLPLMARFPELRQLETVLLAWALGSAAALALGAGVIARLDRAALARAIDWRWVAAGLKIAFPLLVATLALRGLFTFDRYWVEHVAGLDAVGAYTLYVGVASAVMAFLDAAVFVFLYPRLISSFKAGDAAGFRTGMRQLALQTFLVTLLLSALAASLMQPLLTLLDRPVYFEYLPVFYWVLLAIVLYASGMIPHYGLYARGQDRAIIGAHVLGLAVFVISTYVLTAHAGVLAVAWSLCIAFTFIFVWKLLWFLRPPAAAKPFLQPERRPTS